jgi:hypothetical protein
VPLYSYNCAVCGTQAGHLRSYNYREQLPNCCVCGNPMFRIGAESFTIGPQKTSTNRESAPPRPVISMPRSEAHFVNVRITGFATAIDATDTDITGRNLHLSDNKVGIRGIRANIDIDDLKID